MPRGTGQGGVENRFHFRSVSQPAGHGKGVLHVPCHANVQCAHAAQDEVGVVRAHALSEILVRLADALFHFFRNGDGAHEHVGMAGIVLCRGLYGDVATGGEGIEMPAGGPGVVDGHRNTPAAGRRGQSRHVLNLHGKRARGFQKDQGGFRTDAFHELFRGDARVEIFRRNAIAAQQPVGRAARRSVDGIGKQHVGSLFRHRQQQGGNRGQTGGGQKRAMAPLHLRDHAFQRASGRRAVAAVRISSGAGLVVLEALRKDRRSMIDRRIDDPVLRKGPGGVGQHGSASLMA